MKNGLPQTYFIQAGVGGPIKIGVSKCPLTRMAELQGSAPAKLAMIGVINGDCEKQLHAKFARYRIRGEWFSPYHPLLAFINREKRSGMIQKLQKEKKPNGVMSRDEARRRLGKNLRRLLHERKTTPRKLAKEYGLCYRTIQRAAAGESDPALSFIINLAQALGVEGEEFAA